MNEPLDGRAFALVASSGRGVTAVGTPNVKAKANDVMVNSSYGGRCISNFVLKCLVIFYDDNVVFRGIVRNGHFFPK